MFLVFGGAWPQYIRRCSLQALSGTSSVDKAIGPGCARLLRVVFIDWHFSFVEERLQERRLMFDCSSAVVVGRIRETSADCSTSCLFERMLVVHRKPVYLQLVEVVSWMIGECGHCSATCLFQARLVVHEGRIASLRVCKKAWWRRAELHNELIFKRSSVTS